MSENDGMRKPCLTLLGGNEIPVAEGRGIESDDIQFLNNFIGFIGEGAVGNIAYAEANNILMVRNHFQNFVNMIEEFGQMKRVKPKLTKLLPIKSMQSKKMRTSPVIVIK